LFFSGRPRKCSQAEAAEVEAVGVAVVAGVAAAGVVDPAEAEAHGLAAAPDPAVVESQGRVVAVPLVAALPGQEADHPAAVRHRSVNRVAAPAPRNCRPVARA
jgi:hypothetical protein